MPVTYLTEADKKNAQLVKLIRMYMVARGVKSVRALSELTGVSEKTLYDKLNSKRDFSLNELRVIFKALRVSDKDKCEVM